MPFAELMLKYTDAADGRALHNGRSRFHNRQKARMFTVRTVAPVGYKARESKRD